MTVTCKMHVDQDMHAYQRYAHTLSLMFDIMHMGMDGPSNTWIPTELSPESLYR